MDDKISLKAIEQYCNQFSEKLLDSHFAHKEIITGTEILQLSEIRQINLFVIHELFRTWKKENTKIESPYFDYGSPAVQEALSHLMNTLSNHISIRRKDFEPLLKKATFDTLMIIVDPYDFYADLIDGQQNRLDPSAFREQLKYLKINKKPLERLLQKIEDKGIVNLSGNEAFGMLDSILEEVNFTPEDVEGYIAKFSSVLPLSIEALYESKNNNVSKNEPVSQPVPQPISQPKAENKPTLNTIQDIKPTVNEKLRTETKPTLADNFKKIGRIKDSLTINQKFMFTKVLFHGDFELFSKAIDDLDRQDGMNGALKYLEKNFEEWDKESEEFHEFMELLEMRFS